MSLNPDFDDEIQKITQLIEAYDLEWHEEKDLPEILLKLKELSPQTENEQTALLQIYQLLLEKMFYYKGRQSQFSTEEYSTVNEIFENVKNIQASSIVKSTFYLAAMKAALNSNETFIKSEDMIFSHNQLIILFQLAQEKTPSTYRKLLESIPDNETKKSALGQFKTEKRQLADTPSEEAENSQSDLIITACQEGDITTLKQIIENEVQLNVNKLYVTLNQQMLQEQQYAALKLLFERHVDIGKKCRGLLLYYASKSNDEILVNDILQTEVDLYYDDSFGNTAYEMGNDTIRAMLSEKGFTPFIAKHIDAAAKMNPAFETKKKDIHYEPESLQDKVKSLKDKVERLFQQGLFDEQVTESTYADEAGKNALLKKLKEKGEYAVFGRRNQIYSFRTKKEDLEKFKELSKSNVHILKKYLAWELVQRKTNRLLSPEKDKTFSSGNEYPSRELQIGSNTLLVIDLTETDDYSFHVHTMSTAPHDLLNLKKSLEEGGSGFIDKVTYISASFNTKNTAVAVIPNPDKPLFSMQLILSVPPEAIAYTSNSDINSPYNDQVSAALAFRKKIARYQLEMDLRQSLYQEQAERQVGYPVPPSFVRTQLQMDPAYIAEDFAVMGSKPLETPESYAKHTAIVTGALSYNEEILTGNIFNTTPIKISGLMIDENLFNKFMENYPDLSEKQKAYIDESIAILKNLKLPILLTRANLTPQYSLQENYVTFKAHLERVEGKIADIERRKYYAAKRNETDFKTIEDELKHWHDEYAILKNKIKDLHHQVHHQKKFYDISYEKQLQILRDREHYYAIKINGYRSYLVTLEENTTSDAQELGKIREIIEEYQTKRDITQQSIVELNQKMALPLSSLEQDALKQDLNTIQTQLDSIMNTLQDKINKNESKPYNRESKQLAIEKMKLIKELKEDMQSLKDKSSKAKKLQHQDVDYLVYLLQNIQQKNQKLNQSFNNYKNGLFEALLIDKIDKLKILHKHELAAKSR